MPMPRWQNLVAIVAIFFAAGALAPWSTLNRYLCAIVAFALILALLILRLRVHTTPRKRGTRASIEDMQSRIDRIRADREDRFGRR